MASARTVFASRGVEAATIQEITDAADVAKGSFYNHFDSKAAALRAVVEGTLAELAQDLDRLTAPMLADPARVLAVCMRHTLRAGVANPTLGWFLLRAEDALSVAEASLGAVGRRDIERGIRSARFAIDDVDLVSAMIGGAMHAVLRQRLRGELEPAADAAFASRALQLLGVAESEARAIAAEPLPEFGAPPE